MFWGRNFCFNAAIDCSVLGLNALIAIPHTLGLQAGHLGHPLATVHRTHVLFKSSEQLTRRVFQTKITAPPNECHNIPLSLSHSPRGFLQPRMQIGGKF